MANTGTTKWQFQINGGKNDIFPGAFYTTPSNLHREESQANPSNCFTLFLSEEVSLVYQISARV